MLKSTPGPWTAYGNGQIVGSRGGRICNLIYGQEANAQLIVAAPMMLEAFRMGIDPRPDWFEREVIKKNIITHLTDDEIDDGNPWNHKKTCCTIKTLEGIMRGEYGDYIIQGVKGEIYPCKPDIFETTYEALEKTDALIKALDEEQKP